MKIIGKLTILLILCYLFPLFAFAQDMPNNSLDEADATLKQVKALLYDSHDFSQSSEIRLSSALSLNKKADDGIRRLLQEKINAFREIGTATVLARYHMNAMIQPVVPAGNPLNSSLCMK